MKKAFRKFAAWAKRLEDRLSLWLRKHPVLFAAYGSLALAFLFVIFVICGASKCPDCFVWAEPFTAEAAGTSELTPFMFWTGIFFAAGAFFGLFVSLWCDVLFRKKEAAE